VTQWSTWARYQLKIAVSDFFEWKKTRIKRPVMPMPLEQLASTTVSKYKYRSEYFLIRILCFRRHHCSLT
jgi:hypothetical protein